MNRLLVALSLLSLGLLACDPRAGLAVASDSGRVRVDFLNCSRPAQVLPVKSVEVRAVGDRQDGAAGDRLDGAPPACELRWREGTKLTGAWRYGDQVPGYTLRGCAPLAPGRTYEVRAFMAPHTVAKAVFTLESDGRVTPRSGGCD